MSTRWEVYSLMSDERLVERYKEEVCRSEGHEHETRAELLVCVLEQLDERGS